VKNGFFNEKMKLAVSSDENPCATREREMLSRKSRTGLNSADEMSPDAACSESGGEQLDEFCGLLIQFGGGDASLGCRLSAGEVLGPIGVNLLATLL
jgi:hypothetical protein